MEDLLLRIQVIESEYMSMLDELEHLRHFKDTTVGLWCVDQDPKEKSLDWIREHAFQLK